MNKNFKNMSIGAIASVIAGAYYMYGSKDGVAKRKQLAAWSVKMKGEVLQGIEKLKEVSEPKYKEIVKKVAEKYKTVDKGELKKVVDELQSTWNKMKKEVNAEIAKKDAQIAKESKAKAKTAPKKAAPKKAVKVVAKKPVAKKKTASKPAVKSVEVVQAKEKEVTVPVENTDIRL